MKVSFFNDILDCKCFFLRTFARMIEQIIISMPMFVCGVLALELVFSLAKHRDVAKAWLLAWAVTATVLYACHFVYFQRLTSWLPLTDSVYAVCNMAVYPLYLIYLYVMTDERRPGLSLRLTLAAYVGLTVIGGGAVAVLYSQMSADELQQFITHYLYHTDRSLLTGLPVAQAIVHDVCKIVFAFGVILSVIIGGKRLKRYNLMVDQLYADTDDRSLRVLTTMLVCFLVTAVLSLIANAIGRQWFMPDDRLGLVCLSLTSVAFSVMLCGVGLIGLQQQFSVADIDVESLTNDPIPSRSDRLQTVADDFVALMDGEQLYLQPDLRLDTVVKKMNTNRTYLLQALTGQMGVTFTEYVNRRRIEHACRLLARQPGMRRLDVATACGYSSLVTFYRNYKKYAVGEVDLT